MKKNLLPILAGIGIVASIVAFTLLRSGGGTSKHTKGDTSQTWLRYFAKIGTGNRTDQTKDTSSYGLRVVQDSLHIIEHKDTVNGKVTIEKVEDFRVDTLYYVPYDTLVAIPNHEDSAANVADTAHHKEWHGQRKLTLYVPIPREWILEDYNKVINLTTH